MISELLRTFTAILGVIMIVRFCEKKPYEKRVLLIVSAFYVACLIYFTMFRGARDNLNGVSFRFPLPFYRAIQAHRYGLTTNRSVLNLLLFVPMGYLISQSILVFGRKCRIKSWLVLVMGFLISLLIETCQLLFRRGIFELDDLIKNSIGADAGWLIWMLMNKKAQYK